MHIQYNSLSKQRGVTLIELIFVLTIIVLMLVAVVRYYESTRSAQRVNQGIDVINKIIAAAEHWFMTYKTFQTPSVDIAALVDQGLLPSSFKTTNANDPNPNNPWRGSISVSPGTLTNEIIIKLNGLNRPDCLTLCDIMNKTRVIVLTGDNTCDLVCREAGNVSTYTGTYSAVPK
jgi:prepilin-type N-terminal cleavage/methylation domain-containing protein